MNLLSRAALVLALFAIMHATARGEDKVDLKSLPPLAPYTRCEKGAAELLLEIVTSLESVFTDRREQIYLRKTPDGSTIPSPYNMSTNADGMTKGGKGIGYGYSILASLEKAEIQVRVDAHWTMEKERGLNRLEFAIPYLSDASGEVGGFAYTCRWTRVVPANQMPEPTSGSVTPRADARVAPPPPVAHR